MCVGGRERVCGGEEVSYKWHVSVFVIKNICPKQSSSRKTVHCTAMKELGCYSRESCNLWSVDRVSIKHIEVVPLTLRRQPVETQLNRGGWPEEGGGGVWEEDGRRVVEKRLL